MIGGLIGLGIGVLIPFLITHFSGMPTVRGGICVVVAAGDQHEHWNRVRPVPALQAAQVDPIVALRHE
jgi:putative ABC transport system permease protein